MNEAINRRPHPPLVRAMRVTKPIFAFCQGREVVSEVSRHGGLGVLGATRHTPVEISEDLK